jgi:hypothetical protein
VLPTRAGESAATGGRLADPRIAAPGPKSATDLTSSPLSLAIVRSGHGVWLGVRALDRDDASRLAYSEIHDDEKAATVTALTRRALDFFLEHGIVAERVMTDNAFTYVHNRSLHELLAGRGICRARTGRCVVASWGRPVGRRGSPLLLV